MAAKMKAKATFLSLKNILTVFVPLITIFIYLYWIFTKYGDLRKKKSEQIFSWLLDYIFPNDNDSASHGDWLDVCTDVYTLVVEDLHTVYEYTLDLFSALKNLLLLIAALSVLLAILYYLLVKRQIYKNQSNKRPNGRKKGKKKEKIEANKEENGRHETSFHERLTRISVRWWIALFIVSAFLLSLPWEFVRLYQIEVAKRAAVMQGGAPAECIPEDMSIWQSLKYWLQWHFSWQEDPCEKYHRILLVDPLSEVPPMMVLSSAVTRCILHPMELFFGGIGKCLKAFFIEVPTLWQPILMIFFIIIIVLVLVMSCGYRISFPLVFKFEPKTPILFCRQKRCIESCESKNEVQKLKYRESDAE